MEDTKIEQFPGAQEKNYTFAADSNVLAVGAALCSNRVTDSLIARVSESGSWWGVFLRPIGVSEIVEATYGVPKRVEIRGALAGTTVTAGVPRQAVVAAGYPPAWRYWIGGLALPDVTEDDPELVFLAFLSGTITIEGQFPTPKLVCTPV